MADDELKSCEVCGATIYPEHIEAGRAGMWAGQLMCSVCMNEKKSGSSGSSSATAEAAGEGEEEPLMLVDEDDMDKSGSRIIQAIGQGMGQTDQETQFQRTLNTSVDQGATRVKIFHAKMNDGSAAFMTEQVNNWVDQNPDVNVKFAESVVGVWEGKRSEPHLILTVWY